jgi:hypothetical protein
VRLHFAEPEDLEPGERVFDVRLQGKPVLESLDIAKATGDQHRALVKEFRGIQVEEKLLVEFAPLSKSKHPAVLCGVEILAEGW